MTKEQARAIARKRIERMPDAQKEWASGCIADALSGTPEFCGAHTHFIYMGTDGEPNTEEIIGLALMLERTVSVPKVEGERMRAVAITPYTLFGKNKWGILEPLSGRTVTDHDVAVVPMVAFDGVKRLGHGGGYYDKYLQSSSAFKIGLAFDCQQVEGLPVEPYDVPMDMIVTEKRIITPLGETPNIYGEICE